MVQTDIHFKNDLRKELITLEHFMELLDVDKKKNYERRLKKRSSVLMKLCRIDQNQQRIIY